MRAFAFSSLVALLSVGAFGQTAETPAFELADVHVSARGTNQYMRGGALRGDRYELLTATMLSLIHEAYGVDYDKILGGPGWLETDRFDVIAKAPPATPPETLKLMLQALLADRFKLVVHKDTKDLPVYALMVGKRRLQLRAAKGSGDPGCMLQPRPRDPEPGAPVYQSFSCRGISMAEFAAGLPGVGRNYVLWPVVDKTGLQGVWDFDFKYSERGQPLVTAGAEGITFDDALDKQLGLKLDPQKTPTPVLVVDHVNEKPTENAPGVTQKLPTLPTEFEVAYVRPSAPGTNQRGGIQPGGRVDMFAYTLKSLITYAWEIDGDRLVGGPKWLDTDRFDIVAKASTAPASGPQIDFEATQAMLRALLVERFKLAVHNEDRSLAVYALVAPKRDAKLKKADESNRSGCKYAAASAVLSKVYTCLNVTMAQFADRLPTISPAYFDRPVVDATGLQGSFDFILSFTPKGSPLLGGGGGEGGSEPTGAMTVFEALDRQLGLKLESQKHPIPVLVIDHVEQKPTDN